MQEKNSSKTKNANQIKSKYIEIKEYYRSFTIELRQYLLKTIKKSIMRTFKTINQIQLVTGKLVCTLKSGKGKQVVHQRQGSLDSACSAYSLSMALIIIGIIDAQDIIDNNLRKNTREGKFIRDLVENNGWYNEGRTFSNVKEQTDSYLGKIVQTTIFKEKDGDIMNFIKDQIENDLPVLLDIQYDGNGHAIVVVGLLYDKNEKLEALLCLDPGFDTPIISAWNCMIKIKKSGSRDYPHHWYSINGKSQPNVYLHEALAIEKK